MDIQTWIKWLYRYILIVFTFIMLTQSQALSAKIKTRLHKMSNFTGDGVAYHFQVNTDGEKWQYVVYDSPWTLDKHTSNIICKRKHQRNHLVFAARDHPGEVRFHLHCDGTEKSISKCQHSDVKVMTSKYSVGIQCYGGDFEAMYDPVKKRSVKYTEL